MNEYKLEGVESLRVSRAAGNCAIAGVQAPPLLMRCDGAPSIRREGASAEVAFEHDAELEVPPGVAVEIVDCGANLHLNDFSGNLTVGRVAGNLDAFELASIAVRGEVGGNTEISGAQAVRGGQVRGNLKVARVRDLEFDLVGGNAYCDGVADQVVIERVGGRCSVRQAGGLVNFRLVGGKLEVERAGAVKAGMVGSKARVTEVSGDLSIDQVGGKLHAEGIGGSVAVGLVGGHAIVRSVAGDVELTGVGGAAALRGSFAPGRSWRVRSGGRLSAELPGECSVEIEASARRGRVRLHGVRGDLHRSGEDRLTGRIGAGECRMVLESTGADVVLEGDFMHEHGYERGARGRSRFERARCREPLEELAEELGEKIPDLVGGIVGAAGKIVSEAGTLTDDVIRKVARGVGKGLREVDRGLAELERSLPEVLSDKLSDLGREINQVVRDALAQARSQWSPQAQRWREQEAARVRPAEPQPSGAPTGAAERVDPASGRTPDASTGPLGDEEILDILAAVKEGRLEPEEADELIAALMERGSAGPKIEAED